MFYDTKANQHGLPHDPFKAIVSPRPIGWIGTKAKNGSLNLAPYSFFSAVSDKPKMVMFSSAGYKDSLQNAEETGCFTASFAGFDLLHPMNISCLPLPHGESEFEKAGLTPELGRLVDAPFVREAHAALECRVTKIVPLDGLDQPATATAVFGEVVGIHISEAVLINGRFDVTVAKPLARLGYLDYATVDTVFELARPKL